MQPPVFNDNQPDEEEGKKGGALKRNFAILFGVLFVMVTIVGGVFIWNQVKDKNEDTTVSSRVITPSVKKESNEDSEEKNSEESNDDQTADKSDESKEESSSQGHTEKNAELIKITSEDSSSTFTSEGEDSELERIPVEKGITKDTYAGYNQLSDDVDGYQYGTYINVYRMNERRSPATDASPLSLLQIGNALNIVSIQVSGNRVWGELSNGSWVCLKQDSVIYCYGPGIYNCLTTIPVYEAVGSSTQVGQLESGWQVYISQVSWQGTSVWGVLEDGKAIILDTDQKSFVTH